MTYDKTRIFEGEIKEKLKALTDLLQAHSMNAVLSIEVIRDKEEGTAQVIHSIRVDEDASDAMHFLATAATAKDELEFMAGWTVSNIRRAVREHSRKRFEGLNDAFKKRMQVDPETQIVTMEGEDDDDGVTPFKTELN